MTGRKILQEKPLMAIIDLVIELHAHNICSRRNRGHGKLFVTSKCGTSRFV